MWRRFRRYGRRRLRDDFERRAVGRTDRPEVAAIERQQGGHVQPFSDCHDRCIDGAQREVGGLLDKVSGAQVVSFEGVDEFD